MSLQANHLPLCLFPLPKLAMTMQPWLNSTSSSRAPHHVYRGYKHVLGYAILQKNPKNPQSQTQTSIFVATLAVCNPTNKGQEIFESPNLANWRFLERAGAARYPFQDIKSQGAKRTKWVQLREKLKKGNSDVGMILCILYTATTCHNAIENSGHDMKWSPAGRYLEGGIAPPQEVRPKCPVQLAVSRDLQPVWFGFFFLLLVHHVSTHFGLSFSYLARVVPVSTHFGVSRYFLFVPAVANTQSVLSPCPILRFESAFHSCFIPKSSNRNSTKTPWKICGGKTELFGWFVCLPFQRPRPFLAAETAQRQLL